MRWKITGCKLMILTHRRVFWNHFKFLPPLKLLHSLEIILRKQFLSRHVSFIFHCSSDRYRLFLWENKCRRCRARRKKPSEVIRGILSGDIKCVSSIFVNWMESERRISGCDDRKKIVFPFFLRIYPRQRVIWLSPNERELFVVAQLISNLWSF